MSTATKHKVGRPRNGVQRWRCSKCYSAVAQQAVECWSCGAAFVARDGAKKREHETDLAYARRTLARHQANLTRTENAIRKWKRRVLSLEAADRQKHQPHDIRRRGIALHKGE